MQALDTGGMKSVNKYMMNPKLIVSAAAAVAAIAMCGCASSPSDFNDGPYARYGFTYDFGLSPIAPLSTDDAEAVLALPPTTGPGVFVEHNGVLTYYEPLMHVIPVITESIGPVSLYIPPPPPPHAP